MGYFLEKFADWLAENLPYMFNTIYKVFEQFMAPELSAFREIFPMVETFFNVIKAIAIGFVILNLLFQLLRIMMGLISDNSESIMKLVVRSMLILILIFYSGQVMDTVIGLAVAPYDLLKETATSVNFNDIPDVVEKELAKSSGGGADGGGGSWDDSSDASTTASSISVTVLLTIFFSGFIGWNYIKLLFEIVERYLILGIMYYLSPLGFAMGGSESTAPVFKSFCKMLGSQLFLMLINFWFLQVANDALANVVDFSEKKTVGAFLALVAIFGFLRIGQRMDSYLSALGVNTAQTGGGLMADLIGAGIATKAMVGGVSSAIFGKGGVHGRIGDALTGTKPAQSWGTAGSGKRYGGAMEGIGNIAANAKQRMGAPGKAEMRGLANDINGKSPISIDNKKANQAIQSAVAGWGSGNMTKPGAALNMGKAMLGNAVSDGTKLKSGDASTRTGIGSAINAGANGSNPLKNASFSGVKMGKGQITGQAQFADGQSSGFAISLQKPSSGYHQKVKVADGQGGFSTGYAKFDNPGALGNTAAFGKKTEGVGNRRAQDYLAGTSATLGNLSPKSSPNFSHYNGSQTSKMLGELGYNNPTDYKGAHIGKSNGMTYLEKSNGTLDLLKTVDQASAYSGRGVSFAGKDGADYAIESTSRLSESVPTDRNGRSFDDYSYRPIDYDSSYMHMHGESAEAMLNTLDNINVEKYSGVHIGANGTTLLEYADQSGYDELIPAVSVNGKIDEADMATDAEGMAYVVQAHSGKAFDYTSDLVEQSTAEGAGVDDTKAYYAEGHPMLERVLEAYDFKTDATQDHDIQIEAVELHKNEVGRLDYMNVLVKNNTTGSDEYIRLLDPALCEPSAYYADGKMLSGQNGATDVYVQYPNRNGEFSGSLFKPKRTIERK